MIGRPLGVTLCLGTALAACTPTGVRPVDAAQLVATPARLALPPAYVGQRVVGAVAVVNQGGATADAACTISAPFAADCDQLVLPRDGSAPVVVSFTPAAPGPVTGTLTVGTLEVPLEAAGLAVPACAPPSACVAATFDVAAGLCRERALPDGAACETSCVAGACAAGTCVGQLKGCDDGDACTLDACAEVTGCSHLPVTCPAPTAPCLVAACDRARGCGAQPAPDGTLCGPDDCVALLVNVCVTGQCVPRARPATGRCANQWVPTTMPAREALALAYDAAHQRVVAYGGQSAAGSLGETWEWDGASWQQRFPAASPAALRGHALAWDSSRQRVVLFGGAVAVASGYSLAGDTWEWDGLTWVQRPSALSPAAREAHGLAYDSARRRAVLFGGNSWGTLLADTWEWDGAAWSQRATATAPPAREGLAMAYDERRHRVVLHGGRNGYGVLLDDTWEYDGTTWTLATPAGAPPPRANHGLAWDGAAGRLVLFGGLEPRGAQSDTWEYDGASWALRVPATVPPGRRGAGLAYDAARRRVVLFGGFGGSLLSDTWEWDGQDWGLVSPAAPAPRTQHAVAWDGARRQLLLFGGRDGSGGLLGDTWAWDGAWRPLQPARSPSARMHPLLSYDEARRRVVLFGGTGPAGAALTDTWEWDGATWAPCATLPTDLLWAALAFHAPSASTVLVAARSDGGLAVASETWRWDGGTWAPAQPAPTPRPGASLTASPGPGGDVVLFSSQYLGPSLQWAWNGAGWGQQNPAASPFERTPVALAYDSDRQRVVLFGGGGLLISAVFPETWEWDGAGWWQRQPTSSPPVGWGGCAGQMAYDVARQRMTLYDGVDTWRLLP